MCRLVLQFKRLLSRELSQFAESSKAGTQISEYICSTFLGRYYSEHAVCLLTIPFDHFHSIYSANKHLYLSDDGLIKPSF